MNQNDMPAVIGFYGYSQSGKTTLIVEILERLKMRGIMVGVIKVTDKFISSESADKDTSVFRTSGAVITSFSSKKETNFVISEPLIIKENINKLMQLTKLDLIIVEGASDPDIPKIRLGDKPLRENTLFTYTGNIVDVEKKIFEMLNKKGKI